MLDGFGRHLRELRKADGQTVEGLAELLGCDVSYVSDVERGLAPPPEEGDLQTWLTTIGVGPVTMASMVGWGATTRTAFGDEVAEGMTGPEIYQKLQEARGQVAQIAYATYGCNFDEQDPLPFDTLLTRIEALSQLDDHLGTDFLPEDGDTADAIAAHFHRQYEMRAPYHDYKTRGASAVPWADVPDQNKALMREVVQVLLDEGIIDVGGCLDVGESEPLRITAKFEPIAPTSREPVFTRHGDGAGRTRITVELNDALTVDPVRQIVRLGMDFSFSNLRDPLFVLDQFIAIAAAVVRAAHPDATLGVLDHGAASHALAYVELRHLSREAGAEFESADPDVRAMSRAVSEAIWRQLKGERELTQTRRLAPERAVKLPAGMSVVTREDLEAASRPLDAIIAGSVYIRELSDDRMVSRNVLAVEGNTVRYVEFDSGQRDDDQRPIADEGTCTVAEFIAWHRAPLGAALCLHCGTRVDGLPLGTGAVCGKCAPAQAPETIPGFRIVFEQEDDGASLTFVEVEDLAGNSINIGRWLKPEEYDNSPDAERPLCALELPAMTRVPKEPSLLLVDEPIDEDLLNTLRGILRPLGIGPHVLLSKTKYGGRMSVADSLVRSGRALGRHDAEPARALERAAEVLAGMMPLIRSLGGPEQILTETKCGRLDNLLASVVDRGRGNPPIALLITAEGHCHVIGSGITHKMPMVTATHMVLTRALSKLEAREVLPRLSPKGKWRFINEHWSTWHSADSAWDGALVAGERL